MASKCQGLNRNGRPCGRYPLRSTEYCRTHTPKEAEPRDGVDGSGAGATGGGAPARDASSWGRPEFLAALEYTGMVSEACKMVGISRQTAYVERQRNEEFAVAWADVDERVVERLEQEAFRRAHDGVPKKVVSAGQEFGTEQQFSDGLLMFLLKAKRPEKYRERVDVAHSGGVQSDVKVRVDLSALSEDELDALERISGKLQEGA